MLARHAAIVTFVVGIALGAGLVLVQPQGPMWLLNMLNTILFSYLTVLGPILLVGGWLARRFRPGPARVAQLIGAAWTGASVAAVVFGYVTCAFCSDQ